MKNETNKQKKDETSIDLSLDMDLGLDLDMTMDDVDMSDVQADGGIENQEIDQDEFDAIAEQYETPYAKEALPAEIQAYRELMKKEHAKRDANTEGGFYFVIYCDSGIQLDDIFKQLGMDRSSLELDSFIPIRRFARLLNAKHGIKLDILEGTHPEKISFKKNSKLSDLT